MNVNAQSAKGLAIPFDHQRLDRLMDAAGIDVVLATSKHNVQYLLGGHRADFFDYMDATGVTRYLPVLVYPRAQPEKAAYIGHRLEKFQHPEQAGVDAGDADQHLGLGRRHAEGGRPHPQGRASRPSASPPNSASCPMTPRSFLRAAFPDAEWVDALYVLERQRVKKSPEELQALKYASEAVIDSMQAVIDQTTARHEQGRRRRGAAARGNQPRAHLRILPDHRRHQPQPRAVRAEMGEGRHHVARLRRQLPRLYRRHLPHGDPGRAGCRARRSARRDREHPARGLQADPRRRAWARRFMPPPSRWCRNPSTTTTWNFWRTAWAWSATKRRGSPSAGRCLIRQPIRATCRWKRAWWSRSRPRCCIRARLHQARGHRGRHRRRPRDLRRRRARLEQGGHGLSARG